MRRKALRFLICLSEVCSRCALIAGETPAIRYRARRPQCLRSDKLIFRPVYYETRLMLQFKTYFIFLTLLSSFLTLSRPPNVRAGRPVIWEINGRTELLKGDARGVSITDTGVLMLAPHLTE